MALINIPGVRDPLQRSVINLLLGAGLGLAAIIAIREAFGLTPPPNGNGDPDYDSLGFPSELREGYVGSIAPVYESGEPVPGIDTIIRAKRDFQNVPICIVINHNSGNLAGGSVPSGFSNATGRLRDEGISVIAYVHTCWNGSTNCVKPIDEVRRDMDVWARDVPAIQGYFWDEQANWCDGTFYTRQLWDKAKAMGRPFCIGNPGTTTYRCFLDTASVVFPYESGGIPSQSHIDWVAGEFANNRHRVGFIPLQISNLADESYIRRAAIAAKWHYATDRGLGASWNVLHPQFYNMISIMSRINNERA